MQLCDALKKAALDPRVSGLAIEIGPLSVGFAKLIEIRRCGGLEGNSKGSAAGAAVQMARECSCVSAVKPSKAGLLH
jgi:hypothetical protein